MRSLSYVLTGRPRNRTDCIDYAQTHELKKVSVELLSHEDVNEAFVGNVLFAAYVWVFANTVVTYEETYGRCFQHEPLDRQHVGIDNANRRLAKALENLRERIGRPVEGQDARFDYSLAYGK